MYSKSSPLRSWLTQVSTVSLLISAMGVQAAPPGWWSTGSPPVINSSPENNKGVANVGQAKWMALNALEALRANDEQTADLIEADLLDPLGPLPWGWAAPTTPEGFERNRAPLTIGALKALAAPFYKHLCDLDEGWVLTEFAENGLIADFTYFQDSTSGTYFPWNPADNSDSAKNRSIATVGQLKMVFSLRYENLAIVLDSDSDGLTNQEETTLGTDPYDSDSDDDGMADGWEVANNLDPLSASDADSDPDGDKVSNLREFEIGTNPRDSAIADIDVDGVPDDFERAYADWVRFNFQADAPADPFAFDTSFDYGDIGTEALTEFLKPIPAATRVGRGQALMMRQWVEVDHVGLSSAVAAGDGGENYHQYPRGWFFKKASFRRTENWGNAQYQYTRDGTEDLTWEPAAGPVKHSNNWYLLNWTPKWHLHGTYTETETPSLPANAPGTAIKKYETYPGTPSNATYDVAGAAYGSVQNSPAFTRYTPKSGTPYTAPTAAPKSIPKVWGARTMPSQETVGGSVTALYVDPIPTSYQASNDLGGIDYWTMGTQDEPGKSWREYANEAYQAAKVLYAAEPGASAVIPPFYTQGGVGMGVSLYSGDALGELKGRYEKATYSFHGDGHAAFVLIHKQHCRLPGNASMATQAAIERMDEYDSKVIPRDGVVSFTVDTVPAEGYDFVTVIVTPIYPEEAPEILAANTDFDEGRVDTFNYFAIPDCDDIPGVNAATGKGNTQMGLQAQRDHLYGWYAQHDQVEDDMHYGWFGMNPKSMPKSFWDGATITIRKIDKINPEDGLKESGQVRFYAKWGGTTYRGIEPYDMATLLPVNLVTGGANNAPGESIYGSSSVIPNTAYYLMEGVRPGKITLEWRMQKGSLDMKFEQTFEVLTKKTRQEWTDDLQYQIRLQTSVLKPILAAVPTNLYVSKFPLDMTLLDPTKGFLWDYNYAYIVQVYYYYMQLYMQRPEQLYWAGMAKTAGASVYAGMVDMNAWKISATAQGDVPLMAGLDRILNDFLITGNKDIFRDMAWSHRAYVASGIGALNYVERHLSPPAAPLTDFAAWRRIDKGIRGIGATSDLHAGNKDLLRREQFVVMQPLYTAMSGVWLDPDWITQVAGGWVGFTMPPMTGGLINMDECFSLNARNPIDQVAGPEFKVFHPGGRLANFTHRWGWIDNASAGMLQIWLGTSTHVPGFTPTKRITRVNLNHSGHADEYSLSHAFPPAW